MLYCKFVEHKSLPVDNHLWIRLKTKVEDVLHFKVHRPEIFANFYCFYLSPSSPHMYNMRTAQHMSLVSTGYLFLYVLLSRNQQSIVMLRLLYLQVNIYFMIIRNDIIWELIIPLSMRKTKVEVT